MEYTTIDRLVENYYQIAVRMEIILLILWENR